MNELKVQVDELFKSKYRDLLNCAQYDMIDLLGKNTHTDLGLFFFYWEIC